ncbi:hypothetical protein V5799_029747 [Amblyomma americanum]|uniref:Ig-like domain-containing protein n=1 Tax=Amblyomma americanum TaxID=6943 RepID=A0AAQ4EQB8_AMBAM
MECSILAASKVTEVSWRRDGHPVKGLTDEALVTSRYLVIRGVNVTHSGRYTCRVTSADGETTESAPLELRVRHAPRCVEARDTTLAAAPGEPLNVTCPVTADPGEGLRYFWVAEDNAGKRRRMRLGAAPEEHADGDDHVRPSEADSHRLELLVDTYLFHATLSCWARNSVGVQREPCRFSFQLRHERFSSLDCTVGNYTDTSFSLMCTSRRRGHAGRDVLGAALSRLHVQLYDATAGNHSVRSFRAGEGGDGYGHPVFLTGLKPANDYLVVARLEQEMAAFSTYVRTLAPAQTLRERTGTFFGGYHILHQKEIWMSSSLHLAQAVCCIERKQLFSRGYFRVLDT